MAKAHITIPDGTKVTIEGSPDEVAALVAKFGGATSSRSKRERTLKRRTTSAKAGLVSLIAELIDGGFFKKPKALSVIKLALEEQGHFYPATTLSPVLLRLVRKRTLRRIKDKKRWQYVG